MTSGKKCLSSLNSKAWVGMGLGGSKSSIAKGKEHNMGGHNLLLSHSSTPSESYHFLKYKARVLIFTFERELIEIMNVVLNTAGGIIDT